MNAAADTPSDGDVMPRSGPRRWLGILCIVVMLLIACVMCLPWIVGNASVLNALLKSGLSKNEIDGRIGGASLGWFTPASLRDIQFKDQQQRWTITADAASTELSLWQLIWSRGELGELRIQGPTVLIDASRPWPAVVPDESADDEPSSDSGTDGRLRVRIDNGNVLVRTSIDGDPAEFLKNLNVTVDYAQHQEDRMIVVEPGRPIEEANLTREMCNLGIKYIVPILADVTWVSGSMSLQLEECRIPLSRPQEATVKGQLEIRSVESGLQESLAGKITQVVSRLGMTEVPDTVKLAQDSVVKFQVAERRVSHQGLAFGLPGVAPDLVITTQGSVGMDSTLDIVATLPPFGDWMGNGFLAQAMRTNRMTLPVTGTLEQPQVTLEGHQQIIGTLLEQLAPELAADTPLTDDDVDATLNEVGDAVGNVLDLFRQSRERRPDARQKLETDAQGEEVENPETEPPLGIFERLLERRRAGRATRP